MKARMLRCVAGTLFAACAAGLIAYAVHEPFPQACLFVPHGKLVTDPGLSGMRIDPATTPELVLQVRSPDGRIRIPMETFRDTVAGLHERGFRVIGYLETFRDPWWAAEHPDESVRRTDGKPLTHGQSFADPMSDGYRIYFLDLVQDVARCGVDEVMLDFVRYDGRTSLRYPLTQNMPHQQRTEIVAGFVAAVSERLGIMRPATELSVALFVPSRWARVLGQDYDKILPHVDRWYTMAYPDLADPDNPSDAREWRWYFDVFIAKTDKYVGKYKAERRFWAQGFRHVYDKGADGKLHRRTKPLPTDMMIWQLEQAQVNDIDVCLYSGNGKYPTFWEVAE